MGTSFLDPIFNPILTLPNLWGILILSLVITFIITIVYKYATNQSLMKQLKTEMKELQKEIKALRHDPKKAMEVQKQAMQSNMKYMGHSMKATLWTFLPIIILFGWLSAHYAFEPLRPDTEFSTTLELYEGVQGQASIAVVPGLEIIGPAFKDIVQNRASWTLTGKEGEYVIEYTVNDQKYQKEVVVSPNNGIYAEPVQKVNDQVVKNIVIDNKKSIVLNLFGWRLGWLGTYIIFSVIFSLVLRKWMKVY